MQTELQNSNWIRNLNNVNSSTLVQEFTLFFMALADVQLSDHKDEIIWKWTLDGKYSIASAYDCQFRGSIIQFPASSIWQATTEPKCRFFAWLVMHDRVLTTNNLLKKN